MWEDKKKLSLYWGSFREYLPSTWGNYWIYMHWLGNMLENSFKSGQMNCENALDDTNISMTKNHTQPTLTIYLPWWPCILSARKLCRGINCKTNKEKRDPKACVVLLGFFGDEINMYENTKMPLSCMSAFSNWCRCKKCGIYIVHST